MTRPASLLLLAATGLWGCGDAMPCTVQPNAFTGALTITSANPGATTCQNTVDVTFTATGVSTTAVSVAGGDCVRWVNGDTVAHWPESDPHPAHTMCPELNVGAALGAGQSQTTGVLSGPKTCGWHDHLFPPACVGGGGGY